MVLSGPPPVIGFVVCRPRRFLGFVISNSFLIYLHSWFCAGSRPGAKLPPLLPLQLIRGVPSGHFLVAGTGVI